MISIAHSPDSDDYFMFWALRSGLIAGVDQQFSFTPLCTEELNHLACQAEFDVTAASVGVLPYVCETYAVLTHGASVGRGYGPRVISKGFDSIDSLRDKKIGIPGARTTAALVLRQILPKAEFIEIPIQPFNLIFERLEDEKIEAALLIHEGQFYFDTDRYTQLIDLGQWWQETHNLPLPLGVNLIKKSINPNLRQQISTAISRSIRYGIEHVNDALPYLHAVAEKNEGVKLDDQKLLNYLNSYANADSLSIDDSCKRAIELLTSHALFHPAQESSAPRITYQD